MLEQTDVITKEVLVYPTTFHADKVSDSECTEASLCKYVSVCDKCAVMLFGLLVLILYDLFAVCTV